MNVAVLGTIADSDYSAPWEMWQSPALVTAITLVGLGANTHLAASIPEGEAGDALVSQLERARVDATLIQRSAEPVLGRNLPIDDLFTADGCAIDLDDPHLFRFLVDLPVHTHPSAQLAGSLDRLASFSPAIASEIVERLDAVAGSTANARLVTRSDNLHGALRSLQAIMRGDNLRVAFLSGDDRHDYLVTTQAVWRSTTDLSAGSAYIRSGSALGALTAGLARRDDPVDLLRVAVATSRIASWQQPPGEPAASIDIEAYDPS